MGSKTNSRGELRCMDSGVLSEFAVSIGDVPSTVSCGRVDPVGARFDLGDEL
jgi:hypothetical protein